MANFKCTKCPKSFAKDRGLNVHIQRMHNPAGKTWGKKRTTTLTRTRTQAGKSKTATQAVTTLTRRTQSNMQEKIRRVLANYPEGLQVKDIFTKLKEIGYRHGNKPSTAISQKCSNDPEITRVERGIYRLKNTPIETPETDVIIDKKMTHSVPVLLLRINQLERENRALRNAHLTFVREVGV